MNVGVIGAGIAGLSAAQRLQSAGHHAVVFERSGSVGGRLATRRIDGAVVDHGAQFFTVRTPAFASVVDRWVSAGVVREWCRGFDSPDGYPRYVGVDGMNSIAKHVATGLDVRCNAMAFSLHDAAMSASRRWRVKLDDGSVHSFDALVVTCPLPQAASLLVSSGVRMPDELWRTPYDRTLALLVVLDGNHRVPPPGGVQTDPSFTFVGDNVGKGLSVMPALTFHAAPEWSEHHWDAPRPETLAALLDLARPWIGGARVVAAQVKRWRFATPRAIWPASFWSTDDRPDLVVAGDAFNGPRVEGAVLSGRAAADHVLANR